MSADESARPRLDEIEARYSARSAILAEVGWHATRDVPALTAALREVLALHGPEPRYFIGDDEYLFDSPEDASDWHEARALVERLDVCSHCRSIEVGLDGDDGQMGYDPDATYWPCQTVRAITAHIDVTSPALHDPASPERGTP